MIELNLSPEARDDLVEIKTYIAQELCNPRAALDQVSRITKKIRSLAAHPCIGSPLSSILDVQTDYRFLVCDNYLIFYRFQENQVYVTRILYVRRDFMKILLDYD